MPRFPPRRVLVAVDLSAESLFAWGAARDIAQRFAAKLEAVWCLEPLFTEATGLKNLSRRPGYRADALARLRARLGPEARIHVAVGEPAAALRRLARDRGSDLLVVGTHHREGFSRLMTGSVSQALVHDAPCPVLVVPRAWRTPRWILAPVHGADYARRGLLAAAVVARAYRARLALLHVIGDPSSCPDPEELLARRLGQLPAALAAAVRPKLEIRRGDPIREILRAGRGRDLIVLVAHRKSLFGDWILGTTVERVLRHSRAPVLAIPSR